MRPSFTSSLSVGTSLRSGIGDSCLIFSQPSLTLLPPVAVEAVVADEEFLLFLTATVDVGGGMAGCLFSFLVGGVVDTLFATVVFALLFLLLLTDDDDVGGNGGIIERLLLFIISGELDRSRLLLLLYGGGGNNTVDEIEILKKK